MCDGLGVCDGYVPGPGPVPSLRGDVALPEPRLAGDEHLYCPTCAIHEPWVGRVIEAYEGLQAGLQLSDVAPNATAALVSAVTLVALEIEVRNAQQRKDPTRP